MTEPIKTTVDSLLTLVSVLLTAFLWQTPFLLTFCLLGVAILMFLVEAKKQAITIYTIVFLVGSVSEIFLIYFGAWVYTDPHFFNVPIWLPFLWGNAGLFINRLSIHSNR